MAFDKLVSNSVVGATKNGIKMNLTVTALKDKAIDKLKDQMDKINPLSAINISDTEGINKKIQGLRKDKKSNTEKNKKIAANITTKTVFIPYGGGRSH